METQHHQIQKSDKEDSSESEEEEEMEEDENEDQSHNDDNGETSNEDELEEESDTDDASDTDENDAVKTFGNVKSSNHIWRKMIQRILRKWQHDGSVEIPETENDLVLMREEIRDEIYYETLKIWNDYHDLIRSPIYKKLSRSEKHYKNQIMDESDDDSDVDTEAFEYAFDIRKRLLNNFISDNADVVNDFDNMSIAEEN